MSRFQPESSFSRIAWVAIRLSATALLLLAASASASRSQEPARPLSRFRALLRTGEHIEGRGGVFTATTLRGRLRDGRDISIATTDVTALDVRTGSQMLKGAAVGAGFSALTAALAILAVENDPTLETEGTTFGGVFVGFTIAGALIGAAVGSRFDQWDHVALGLSPSPNRARLGLSFRFTHLPLPVLDGPR